MKGLGFFGIITTVIFLWIIHYGVSYRSTAVKLKGIPVTDNARKQLVTSPTPDTMPQTTTIFPGAPFNHAADETNIQEQLPGDVLKNKGAVIIKTDPSMAKLYVDGRFLGHTPYKLNRAVGKYKITLEKSGYASKTEEITVFSGKTVIVKKTCEVKFTGIHL
ncbi:PEGA domain-containing protein [Candidatus Magnetobacterium casense]|uniref:PEGA domain-containing protein n=1 Tax=Candidatus Magnetobacterium casense TaxID=1455061 RepID=A0ABS6RYC7_9BACT|nr:PEGA domain-containing protein [Candidatus Magnetobacterium casensis]MBV6341641.1 PEGA domain-containing protein [Candidatus Magnetobacterium casensis]